MKTAAGIILLLLYFPNRMRSVEEVDNYLNKVISDRYEIKEIIGVGGMALVYKAYDRVDDRVVAIKILKDEYLTNEEYRLRFKNESKAISVLNHPNIVKVYDVCFSDTIQYIVMEHVEGITLKEFIKRQQVLEWKEALLFVVQILKALQHAHDKGVIHRDIKPQNILLLPNASIKVTDFGIAGFKRGEIQTFSDNDAIGSVHYVSPEQAKGDYTDEKSDIYSVGVVMYEMLTGRMPFESESDENVAWMQVESEAVRPTEINPFIPDGLEQITLRAMQKNPADRYQSAAEFLMDIDELRKNPDVLFDYEYFIDKNPTKYIEPGVNPGEAKKSVAAKPIEADIDEDDSDEDSGRSSSLTILIGAAVALVLVVVVIVFAVFGGSIKEYFGGDSTSQSEDDGFLAKLDIFGIFSKDKVEVPHFINMKFEDALAQYPDLAIENPPQYEYNSSYEDGYVSKQYPDAGDKVSKDTVIKLTVATSREMVLIQDVSGYSTTEAEETLRASGLVVELVPIVDDTKKDGEVIYSSPAANSYTAFKSTVYVYYAVSSSNIGSARVPNVIGFQVEAAKQKILNAGLKVGTITEGPSSPSLKGFVISQTPDATTPVKEGISVNVVVGNGIPASNTAVFSISLPGVGDGSSSTLKTYLNGVAYDTISGVALNGGNYQLSFTGSGADNTFEIYADSVLVYSGEIDFTTTPPSFSNVHGYQMSTKKSVPNVVGMSESSAEASLSGAGFNRVKVVYEASDSVAEGIVISQSPANSDSSKYATATIVTIVVSEGPSEVGTNEAPSSDTPSVDVPENDTSSESPSVTPETTVPVVSPGTEENTTA